MVTENRRMLTWNELIRPSNIGREITVVWVDPDTPLKKPVYISRIVTLYGSANIGDQRVLIVHWDYDDEIYLITSEGQNVFWNAYLTDDQMLWYEYWKL